MNSRPVLLDALSYLGNLMLPMLGAKESLIVNNPQLLAEAVQQEAALRERADRACGQFLERGSWLDEGPILAILCEARIRAAHTAAQKHASARKPIASIPSHDLKEYLRWLLVDYWHEEGAKRWNTETRKLLQ